MKLNSFRISCLAVGAVIMLASACKGATDGLPVRNTGHYAIIETERGTIVLELYPEAAPKTVANFETLVNKGFYNEQPDVASRRPGLRDPGRRS